MHTDTGSVGLWKSTGSMLRRYTVQHVITFDMCTRFTCTYVLSLVCLGIVREYSVLLIASLGIHAAENPVNSQGAFVCPGSRPHIFAQALRVIGGHWCLYPYGLREHV